MTVLWPRLFDGAVSLVRTLADAPRRGSIGRRRPPRCAGGRERLPRRYFRFRMGLSPVRIARGISPRSVRRSKADALASAALGDVSRMNRENGVLFHCGALLDSHPPSPLQETEREGIEGRRGRAGDVRLCKKLRRN